MGGCAGQPEALASLRPLPATCLLSCNSQPTPAVLPRIPPPVAFRIYDADDDGFVTRADLLRQLQQTNRRGLSAGQLEEIVSSTVRGMGAGWAWLLRVRLPLCLQLAAPALGTPWEGSLQQHRCPAAPFPTWMQVATFDADGDGQLCYEEFRALLSDSATQQALKF